MAEFKSPRIAHLSWGHIEIEGHPPFKDAKILARGSGTGVKPVHAMCPVFSLPTSEIDRGAKAVVLSKGIWEQLQVCPETLEVLAKNGIEAEVLQTGLP
jgi:hypothetical protein